MHRKSVASCRAAVWKLGAVLHLVAVAAFAADGDKGQKEFRAGFAHVNITPPVGSIITGPRHPVSVGQDDPLFAKALVVRSGDRMLAIVGLDLVKIRQDLAEEAMAQIARRTGIHHDAVILCPSHNHSSPFIPEGGPANRDYLATLPGLIADSVERAYKALEPAHMFIGRALVLEGHHNRRLISKADGLVLNTWLKKLNDLHQTPQVLGTEGPIDPELWVARFDAADGKVLGTLVNFTCHPSLHDRSGLRTWSADFPGVIAEHIAQAYGPQAVCVFTQGASGNIAPPVQFTPDWRQRSAVFARAAVDAAKQAIPVDEPVAIGYARRDVVVPLRDPADQRPEAITRLGWRPESFEEARRQAARKPLTRKVPVNAMRIGPLAIATNAGELFVEWGLSVKKQSPFPYTVVSELTNDWVGYEPTAQAFSHEGYETLIGVDFVSLKGIETLVDTSVELLQELWKDHGKTAAVGSATTATESAASRSSLLPPREGGRRPDEGSGASAQSSGAKPWQSPAFERWVKDVQALPAEQQIKVVSRKLIELNPNFDGTLTSSDGSGKPTIAGGLITAIGLISDHVTDLSPLRALMGLQTFGCHGTKPGAGQLADLSPLAGLPLTYLHCHMTRVSDLSPLRGMKLVELVCASTAVSDLSPLAGMPLTLLYCSTTQVSDLSPLRGMPLASLRVARTKVSSLAPLEGLPLTELDCHLQPVSDLTPLRGMQLARLHCADTRVSDLSPLEGMNLVEITFSPQNIVKGLDILRRMKSLKAIGGVSTERLAPAAFWQKYDAGEYGKPNVGQPSPASARTPEGVQPSKAAGQRS